MNVLNALVGQHLLRIEEVHDYHQLEFTDYLLNVFNSMLVEKQEGFDGYPQQVVVVRETETEVEIVLSDGTAIAVDLRPTGWKGPEAMALYRGDDCVAVWT